MEENYKIGFGRRLRAERKLRHFTQEQMAEKLGISLKHYGAVERGITGLSVENLILLSNMMGISLDYLLKGETRTDSQQYTQLEQLYELCPPEKRVHLVELLKAGINLTLDDTMKPL